MDFLGTEIIDLDRYISLGFSHLTYLSGFLWISILESSVLLMPTCHAQILSSSKLLIKSQDWIIPKLLNHSQHLYVWLSNWI